METPLKQPKGVSASRGSETALQAKVINNTWCFLPEISVFSDSKYSIVLFGLSIYFRVDFWCSLKSNVSMSTKLLKNNLIVFLIF